VINHRRKLKKEEGLNWIKVSLKLICGKFEEISIKENIKLCFLDPPDNEGRAYENYKDNLTDGEYVGLLNKWMELACEITNGPVFFSVAEKWINEIEHILAFGHIKLIQRIWWHYTFGQAQKLRYTPCVRPIYWLNKPVIYPDAIKVPSDRQLKYNDKRAAYGGKLPSNVWKFSRICGTFKEKRRWHVNQHPEALMERIVLGHSREGDWILDGFIGKCLNCYL
jgi:site-specific DNA-methyltransferase (adenine-specific)